MTRSGQWLLWSLIVSCSVAVGCSKAKGRDATEELPPDGVLISGAGSTFAAPLYQAWSNAYHLVSPKAMIKYDAVGSGEGQDRFVKGTVDFGASDAMLSAEQIAAVEGGALTIPIASGGIVLAYNAEGLGDGLRLPRDVYVDIFLGKITHWNDVRIAAANPGAALPNLPISRVVRLDSSGTTYAFTSHLSAISAEWRDGPGAGKIASWQGKFSKVPGNERVAGLVKQMHGAIGYVEFGTARAAGLKMAAIENRSGDFVTPSNESIQLGVASLEREATRQTAFDPDAKGAYPIVTTTWLFIRKKGSDSKRTEELRNFVHWCLTEGQKRCERLGYVQLAPEATSRAIESLDAITR